MRRHYTQTVTLIDGSTVHTQKVTEPTSPAQTRILSADQANEPERMEVTPPAASQSLLGAVAPGAS